ncbi:MAG TPA: phosphotransferase [Candidatus Dojkabacteria bacterium]|jgi:Ser/Thr protein kinase RdoA (MazF antagonist)|nr:phosphotransferase [Candidatus Dojkabacteria bacterium]
MKEISRLISNRYGFNVESVSVALRGFVGETYIINTDKKKYFLKIFQDNRYFANVLQGLPVLRELKDLGVNYINFPIFTKEKTLYFVENNRYYILFNYIKGENTEEYELSKVFQQLIEISKLTKSIKSPIKRENFNVLYVESFEESIERYKDVSVIQNHLDGVLNHWSRFKDLANTLKRRSHAMYITHGDAFGNVIKDKEDLYIIDWDDLLLAPLERDLWFFFDNQEVIELYRKEFPNFHMDRDIILYYVYNRFFDDLLGFFELLDQQKEYESVVESIQKDCFDWTYKLIEELV